MPLPSDRRSLEILAAETEREIGKRGSADTPERARRHARQLLQLAEIRARLGEDSKAEQHFANAASEFSKLDSDLGREAAAAARIRQATLVMADGRHGEALSIFDQIIDQSEGFPLFRTLDEMQSSGLDIWLLLIEGTGESERLYAATSVALDRLQATGLAANSFVLARTLLRRAKAASALGYTDEATESYGRAIACWEANGTDDDGEDLAEAMLRLTALLARSGREAEVSVMLGRIVEAFDGRTESWALEALALAQAWQA